MRLIRAYIYLSFLILIISCSRRSNRDPDIGRGQEITYAPRAPLSDSVQSLIRSHNARWLDSWSERGRRLDLSDFTKDTCFRCADIKRDTLLPDSSFMNAPARLLYYSPDSTRLIDIHNTSRIARSNQKGLTAKSEAFMVDLKRRWQYTLSFPGGTEGFSDALWLDGNSFLLLGWRQSWDSLNNRFTSNYLPHIELFDIGLQMKCIYNYKGGKW